MNKPIKDLETELKIERERYMENSYRGQIRKILMYNNENVNRYNAFITLNPNKPRMDIVSLQRSVEHLYNNLTSRLFRGNKYYEVNYNKHFNYYGFLEHTLTESPHYHLIAFIAPSKYEYLTKILGKFWFKQIKGGTVDMQYIDIDKFKIVMDYSTKYLNHETSKNNVILPPVKKIL